MKGLELSRRHYFEIGRPAILKNCPEALPRIAAGLVGEGSECLGFDDDISRDHDWGPGFCLWLTDDDYDLFGTALTEVYRSLPASWNGYERLRPDPLSGTRVGVMRLTDFYDRFLGLRRPPQTVGEWLQLSDEALCLCTGGEVFEDGPGAFSAFRRQLQGYYPDEIALKRLAARCGLAARAGQYQLPRCLLRGDRVAAFRALADFVNHAQAVLFLLERQYRPYYKWAHRALKQFPDARDAVTLFEAISEVTPDKATAAVEDLCHLLAERLRAEGFSRTQDDFLLAHAREIQASIPHEGIRSLPLLAFP